VRKLSPSDPLSYWVNPMAKATCKKTVRIVLYVPLAYSLDKLMNVVKQLGFRIKSVNQELRRLVLESRCERYESCQSKIQALQSETSVSIARLELSCSCRLKRRCSSSLMKKIISNNFTLERRVDIVVLYGVLNSRIVLIEIKQGKIVTCIIGKETKATSLPIKPSRSLFNFKDEGLGKAYKALEQIEAMVVGCRNNSSGLPG
jgi:hypothetical protein